MFEIWHSIKKCWITKLSFGELRANDAQLTRHHKQTYQKFSHQSKVNIQQQRPMGRVCLQLRAVAHEFTHFWSVSFLVCVDGVNVIELKQL